MPATFSASRFDFNLVSTNFLDEGTPKLPRGYRQLRSSAEMKKLLNRKIAEQNGICPICDEAFTDYSDVVPDYKEPKGMGGAWRDDHPDNIQAAHWWCNEEKGSTRM
jgi:hypothetical protein